MFADIARDDIYCLLRHSTVDWLIVNPLSEHQNGNNPALVNFHSIVSEFMLLKCAIFAAIWPQFDIDLYSSPWHSEMDWKIAILISAE